LGPWLVTRDEIPDPTRLTLATRLNGTEMQRSGTDLLIYSIPQIIAFCSDFTLLSPGDVIATGTPEGVGHRRTPPVWMKAGDALVMQNASDWLGGYVKWFTDVPAHNDYPRTVIFHHDDLMTLVEMGATGRRDKLGGKDINNPGIGEIIYSPSFFSIAYTHDYDPVLVAEELAHRGYKTIGLIGRGALPSGLVDAIRNKVSANLVDASDLVDRIKSIKSPEEIAL